MADVEIAVNAEGVEDAVGEVPEGETPEVSGADEDAGGGAGRGRGMGKVVALIGAVLTFAQDILQVVSVFSTIARAFLAPLAVMLFRLLAPVMRLFLSVLPAWLDFVDSNDGLRKALVGLVPFLTFLPSIVQGIQDFWNWLQGAWEDLKDLPSMAQDFADKLPSPGTLAQEFWNKMKALPGMIATALKEKIGLGGDPSPRSNSFEGTPLERKEDDGFLERGAKTTIQISGGLTPFIERLQRSTGIDS